MATKYTLYIDQGEDFEFKLIIKDGDGNPIDITGYVFEAQFRSAESLQADLQATGQFDLTDPENGTVILFIPSEDTTAMSGEPIDGVAGRVMGNWDLFITGTDGKRKLYLEGPYFLNLGVTDHG